MASRNPVDEWTMTPINETHPVLNGIASFLGATIAAVIVLFFGDKFRGEPNFGAIDSIYNSLIFKVIKKTILAG